MQTCGECGKVYDESEYAKCPYCYGDDYGTMIHIVFDDAAGEVKELTDEEYEEFKKTHPDYH